MTGILFYITRTTKYEYLVHKNQAICALIELMAVKSSFIALIVLFLYGFQYKSTAYEYCLQNLHVNITIIYNKKINVNGMILSCQDNIGLNMCI